MNLPEYQRAVDEAINEHTMACEKAHAVLAERLQSARADFFDVRDEEVSNRKRYMEDQ